MGTVILVTIISGAGAYFLFGYIESKCNWVKRPDWRIGLTFGFASFGFCFGYALAVYLSVLIPPERPVKYYEEDICLLSPFIDEKESIYGIIEGEDVVFMQQKKLVQKRPLLIRRKKEEIKDVVIILPEGSTIPPKMVKFNEARSKFFGKYFLFSSYCVKFFIPAAGIREGKVKFIEGYVFIPLPEK